MSKSVFEKWYQREYVGDSTETFKAEIFHRHARAIALARLRWVLKQHPLTDQFRAKLQAEIKKVEAENDNNETS